MSKNRKWCLVLACKNTSLTHPNKEFIQVPSEKTLRIQWFQAAGRDPNTLSFKSSLFICEDHFDVSITTCVFSLRMKLYELCFFQLPNDMENFLEWQMTSCKKRMRSTVVPHKNLYETMLSEPSTSKDVPSRTSKSTNIEITEIPQKRARFDGHASQQFASNVQAVHCDTKDVAIWAKPHYRSKGVQFAPQTTHQFCSPLRPQCKETSTSPLKMSQVISVRKMELPKKKLVFDSDISEDIPIPSQSSSESFAIPFQSSSEELRDSENNASLSFKVTMTKINSNPRRYIGISKNNMWIVEVIQGHTGVKITSLYLTLMKIRTSRTFAELGDDFGVTESTASRMFKETVPFLSPIMKELVAWSPSEQIQKLLPMSFRARFGKVQSIIDCFEIEINKPKDALKQALTWSEYKKANIIKYLISSTPDGFINFISKGFGGRTSDQTIIENSGYLDVLKPGMVVMADRGFKNIDKLLNEKGCILVRPPSVSTDTKLSKEEVLTTKRIASLRIHVERVIRRLREFKFLKPHACIHSKSISLTDHILCIVCGLVNLQDVLIK